MRISLLAVLLVACAPPPAPPASPPTPTSSATVDAPAPAAQTVRPVELEIKTAEGASRSDVHAIFSSALPSLERCLPEGGGVLRFVVTSKAGGLSVAFEPTSSTDPRVRACAADVLRQTYLSETGSNVGGPALPKTGFTSLITVAW